MKSQPELSIVFCHGIWADGSCFSKVIPPLQAEGHEVIAAQYGLNSSEEDVAMVKRTLGRVSSPAILVGHSYGGSVITAAGTDDRVVGLVYIAAVAPDTGETTQGQLDNFPPTGVFSHIEVAEGRVWLKPDGPKYFAGDLSEEDQKLAWATHYAPAADLGDALRMFEARLASRKASQAPETMVQTVVDENAPIVKIVNVILRSEERRVGKECA